MNWKVVLCCSIAFVVGAWLLFFEKEQAHPEAEMGSEPPAQKTVKNRSIVTNTGSVPASLHTRVVEALPKESEPQRIQPTLAEMSPSRPQSVPNSAKKQWARGYDENFQHSLSSMEDEQLVGFMRKLIDDMRYQVKGYPGRASLPPHVHDNYTLTEVLLGNNPGGLKFLDIAGAPINKNGEVTDRAGVPLFFHFLDATSVDVHAAGPDQLMWTKDDIVSASKMSVPSLK